MQPQSLFTLALVALASASPVKRQGGGSCSRPKPVVPTTTGNGEDLTGPNGLSLKYIALGHGIQNYTCTPGEPAKATGALAFLYDATELYPAQGPNSLPTVDHFDALTTTLLWTGHLPLNPDGETQYGAATPPFPPAHDLDLPGAALPFLGLHLFDSAGVPTFFTGESEENADFCLKAKLNERIPAPASADVGPVGTGAVPWLHLEDNGSSKGFSHVYRVITAGGSPQTCVDDAPQSVPYTTFYWFYGPEV